MKILFTPFKIGHLTLSNRLCVPAMVRYDRGSGDNTAEGRDVEHYGALAGGGFGFITVEASAVATEGRLCEVELGVWDDRFIPGLARIADRIHAEGGRGVLQLHHAGLLSIGTEPMAPSEYRCTFRDRVFEAREMTKAEIQQVQELYAQAARRAQTAGFDGVELHGCHNYLISQFLSRSINRRTDEYGVNPEKFLVEVFEKVKRAVTGDFIVGIRLGGFEPELADGIRHAKIAEECGADYISVSYGFSLEHSPFKPESYPFLDYIYAAQEIKRNVSVPLLAVNSIVSPEQAEEILALSGVDGVCIGRGSRINPNWVNDAMAGRPTGRCLNCPKCYWRLHMPRCPGLEELTRIKTSQ